MIYYNYCNYCIMQDYYFFSLNKIRQDQQVQQRKYSLQHSDVLAVGPSPVLQAPVLEFDWRSAFRGLVPHMAHCVKVVLDDACAKSLQQEEALHSSGNTSIDLSCTAGHTTITASNAHLRKDSFSTYTERESPKMIAKVLQDFCQYRLTAGLSLLVDYGSDFVRL